ncbi:MAG: binding-protein-dependent transport system inner rane component [Conexibacter sp.]|nr:binding-protein-dependent transport system inner rane component [Conexibacter sp.]
MVMSGEHPSAAGEVAAVAGPSTPNAAADAVRRRGRRNTWVIRRLVIAVATLVALSIIVFAATQALPGNAAQELLGHTGTPERVAALSRQLGLDHSVVSQYLRWAGNFVTGNLGQSLSAREPVTRLLAAPVLNSLILISASAVVSIVLAIVLGVAAAARRDRLFDHLFAAFAFLFTAVPEFVVGLMLVILFATTVLVVLPAVSIIPAGSGPFSHLDIFVLPVATLVLTCVPYLARLVRGSMIEALESEYVRMARFKGLAERRILFRHALPNALVPALQGIAVVLGYLAGGIVVVEYVFGFPGIGTALIQAISFRDIPVIQAICLMLAAVYVVVNLFTDVLVVFVTPRLRTAQS